MGGSLIALLSYGGVPLIYNLERRSLTSLKTPVEPISSQAQFFSVDSQLYYLSGRNMTLWDVNPQGPQLKVE